MTAHEKMNAWRIMPRILMTVFYTFFILTFVWVTQWFMDYDFAKIENQAVALAIAGFPTAILAVLSGVLGKLTDNYFRTGGTKDD